MVKRLARSLAVLAGTALMATGCAVAGSPVMAPAGAPSATASSAAAPRAGEAPPQAESDRVAGPSAAARMVCGAEIRDRIAQILSLPAAPVPASTWAEGLYTCTYDLPAGKLVLSVKETSDPGTAQSYAQSAVAGLPGAAPIEGLANLGLPAYRTGAGAVVFAKDSFALTVDAAGLREPVGPESITRSALAYQVATDVLACWSE